MKQHAVSILVLGSPLQFLLSPFSTVLPKGFILTFESWHSWWHLLAAKIEAEYVGKLLPAAAADFCGKQTLKRVGNDCCSKPKNAHSKMITLCRRHANKVPNYISWYVEMHLISGHTHNSTLGAENEESSQSLALPR